jgi:6-phosphogluconolactonase (cycloisomerase 2 family)
MLFVNYWDSTVGSMPLTSDGMLEPVCYKHTPPQKMVAGVRSNHLQDRQSEPHAHAIVLDPVFGRVAFVPDLGLDVIKQFIYDECTGNLQPAPSLPANSMCPGPHGPRYIEFHPVLNVAYVVNEISSTVSVMEFSEVEAAVMQQSQQGSDSAATTTTTTERQPLTQMQSLSTLPLAYPRELNTCGRIALDPTGNFVLVSNRGHDSITVFRVRREFGGQLTTVGHFHTRGATPRHFKFNSNGKVLIVANQDTDSIVVFKFDQETGKIAYTGNTYTVPSPNFICSTLVQPTRVGRHRTRL